MPKDGDPIPYDALAQSIPDSRLDPRPPITEAYDGNLDAGYGNEEIRGDIAPADSADEVGNSLTNNKLADVTTGATEVARHSDERVIEVADEEWLTCNGIAKALGIYSSKAQKLIDAKIADHPEWVDTAPRGRYAKARYHSGLLAILRSEVVEKVVVPEGWATCTGLARELGVRNERIQALLDQKMAARPGGKHTIKGGRLDTTYYNSELVAEVREEIGAQFAPEGWTANPSLVKELSLSPKSIEGIATKYQEKHPEWFATHKGRGKASSHISEFYHPELVRLIREEAAGRKPAPEGWMTNLAAAQCTSLPEKMARKVVNTLREEHPEWFVTFTDRTGRTREHYHPDLITFLRNYDGLTTAPEGWVTANSVATDLGVSHRLVGRLMEAHRSEHPEWFVTYKGGAGNPVEHCHPQLAQSIREYITSRTAAPDGWVARLSLATEMGVTIKVIDRLIEDQREEHPEWLADHLSAARRVIEYMHPDLVKYITLNIKAKSAALGEKVQAQAEQNRLQKDIQEALMGIRGGEGPDAQEFQMLVGLFGAECAVDILYHQHPEYGKLPVPYVRSALADYLGDFLSIRGGFSLEALEKGAPLLGNTTFKDAFVEVVKGDCLRLLNHISRTDPDSLSAGAIREYMADLRQATARFENSHLNEALDEVEAYYQLLFQNIHKPDRFIDGLEDGRLFPDINQRINVQEISFKERVLIADEMGTGKSASAIMAKEIIGVRQALAILPSNVIDTWLGYLSDQVGEDGEQIGYFKPGQTPRVLVVDSLQALQDANPDEYEYILISQERLNESYVEALGRFNYNMLIVDEMHKLKNISDGKRAESLLALSQRIEDAGNYLVLLSGTPVPNKVSDIAITLKLLYPQEFRDVDDKDLVNQIVRGDLLNLRSLLVPRMQMKSLAETVDMPEHEEIVRTFPLSSQEREVYEILIDEDELTAAEKLTILRQCVLNPRFLDATPDLESSKIAVVGEDLRQTFTEKDKVVMFVNNYVEGVIRGDVTILEELGVPGDVEVLIIDGSVDKQRRREIQQELNRGHKKVLVVVSGQTADVGVDFSGAQEVYIYNEPWTMYDKRQAISRVYRPGLKAPLKTRTYVAADTIEQGIHRYIETKYQAVEKLLRGVPISEIEAQMLRRTEAANGSEAEVNAELAEYYFSSWDKMMRIYSQVKELGEKDFQKFLDKYGDDYAESYASIVGSRSYQANVSRMAASHIRSLALADGKKPEEVVVLDVASGPEMLKKHAPSDLASRVLSLDINAKHFTGPGTNRIVGSFVNMPIRDKAVDYVNLSLGLHYTSFAPRRGNYERLKVLQEVNRVLPIGGQALVSMIYSMDLPYDDSFNAVMNKLGFLVVDAYSGEVANGNNFRTQLITLRKIRDCSPDTKTVVGELGPQGLQSLKLKRTKASLRNSRGILTKYSVNDATIQAVLNENDQAVLEEEGQATQQMEGLKQRYGAIEAIPREVIQQSGLSRIFNGKRYVLFKRLNSDPTAVVIK